LAGDDVDSGPTVSAWGFGSLTDGFLAANLATYATRAAAASGRHIIYLVAAAQGGAAIRVNPDGAQHTSIELPDFTLMTGFDALEVIAKAPRRAKARKRAIRNALDRFGDIIWRPIMENWPELYSARLAVIPVGEMAHIPIFTGIVDGVPACARWDITVVSSSRALLVASSKAATPAVSAAVLADTGRGRHGLPQLAFAAGEARRIADEYDVDPAVLDALNEPSVEIVDLIRDVPVVHLICHGEVDHEEPFSSLLHLGQGLRLERIWRYRFRAAPVVVLSACDVGGISGDQPAEQLGFTTAFLLCGARAVVGALWEVPDCPETVELMTEFHSMLRLGMPANTALGAAIAAALRRDVSSTVWGPFAHFGA
jgi:CHAT domain-containing protein